MQMKHYKGNFKAQADLCRVSFTVWKATAEGCLLWERKYIVKAYEQSRNNTGQHRRCHTKESPASSGNYTGGRSLKYYTVKARLITQQIRPRKKKNLHTVSQQKCSVICPYLASSTVTQVILCTLDIHLQAFSPFQYFPEQFFFFNLIIPLTLLKKNSVFWIQFLFPYS